MAMKNTFRIFKLVKNFMHSFAKMCVYSMSSTTINLCNECCNIFSSKYYHLLGTTSYTDFFFYILFVLLTLKECRLLLCKKLRIRRKEYNDATHMNVNKPNQNTQSMGDNRLKRLTLKCADCRRFVNTSLLLRDSLYSIRKIVAVQNDVIVYFGKGEHALC